jgi:hypothetical protein
MGGGLSNIRTSRFTSGKETRYPLHRKLGGPEGGPGRVRNISHPPGFDPRTVQSVASPSELSQPKINKQTKKQTLRYQERQITDKRRSVWCEIPSRKSNLTPHFGFNDNAWLVLGEVRGPTVGRDINSWSSPPGKSGDNAWNYKTTASFKEAALEFEATDSAVT